VTTAVLPSTLDEIILEKYRNKTLIK
jgi:hypothetical protein